MNHFLQGLRVQYGLNFATCHAIQKSHGGRLVGVFRTHRVNQEVRIRQNHGSGPTGGIDCRFISSTEPVGRDIAAISATAATRARVVANPY